MSVQRIGRYEVLRQLGQGGMSVVYLAHDPYVKRQVAIKVLPRQLTFDPQFRTRFQREAEVIAALEHAFIVPIHDFGEHDDQPFIVMRYMPGGSLLERLAPGPIGLPELARLTGRVADALDEAHSRGVIHRDIKPGNVLFDARGEAFLSDFGIAKIAESKAALTGTGIVGTPEYMSPEQARGTSVDGRCDVYSLGATLFHALTGRVPYKASTPLATAMAHILEPVPSILTVKPDLPAGCEAIMARALAKEPADRYATAGQLARDLSRLAAAPAEPGKIADVPREQTVLEPPPPPPARTVPPPASTAQIGVTSIPGPPVARQRGTGRGVWIALGGIAVISLICLLGAVILALSQLPGPAGTETPSAQSSALPTEPVELSETTTAQAYGTGTAQAQLAETEVARVNQSATAEAQQTAVALENIRATVAAVARWPLVTSDSFVSDVNNWPTGNESDEYANINRQITNGKYRWKVDALKGVVSRVKFGARSVGDFYLAVAAQQVIGSADSEYGLIFRDDGNNNYYLFVAADYQKFALYVRDNDQWATLIDWTDTLVIRPGDVNRLAVSAEGSHFLLLINNEYVGEAYDSRISSGKAGVATQLHNAGDTAVYEFDNFELRAP